MPSAPINAHEACAHVDPWLIIKILTHLDLPARAPPRSPARPFTLFQAAGPLDPRPASIPQPAGPLVARSSCAGASAQMRLDISGLGP